MAIADEINIKIDEVLNNYNDAMIEAGAIAWNKVRGSIRSMNVDDRGKLVGGQPHKITEVGQALVEAIQSSRVTRAKERMKNQLDPIRLQIRDFYEDKFGVAPYEVTRAGVGLTESTKNRLDNELGEDGFDQGVVIPAETALSAHMAQQSTLDATENDMQHRILARLANFTQVKAATILQQFGREISDLYGNQQGRKALYSGPQDDLNREFCAQRVGKKFNHEQIKGWALDDWEGKIPSTNSQSIFNNLGGYNCRHILEWEQ